MRRLYLGRNKPRKLRIKERRDVGGRERKAGENMKLGNIKQCSPNPRLLCCSQFTGHIETGLQGRPAPQYSPWKEKGERREDLSARLLPIFYSPLIKFTP